MSKKFKNEELYKEELNCGVMIVPLLKYFEKFIDNKELFDLVESSGASYSYLINKKNWISNDYFNFLLKKLIEITRDIKAPYKMPSSMADSSFIFTEFINVSYAFVLLGTPKIFYKIMFNKNFYKSFQKIGDFNILEETKTSIKFEYFLKEGYVHDENNCLAVSGYIFYYTQVYNFPIPKITQNIVSDRKCIFDINWERQSKLINLLSFFSFFIISALNLILFIKKIVPVSYSLIAMLIYFNIVFLIKYLQYKKRHKLSILFNQENSNTVVDALLKVENNYNELLKKEKIIIERNIYLTIINEVRKSIYEALYFTPVLFKITKIILDQLLSIKAVYFEYNFTKDVYEPVFDLNNDLYDDSAINTINFMEIIINKQIDILKSNYNHNIIQIKNIDLIKYSNNEFKVNNNSDLKDLDLFLVFIDFKDRYKGFYIFYINKNKIYSDELFTIAFNDIIDQLRISYNNIANRNIIENILSSIPGYVVIFNKDNYLINYINNMFLKSFPILTDKYSKTEIIGKNLFEILPFNENVKNSIIASIQGLKHSVRSETMEIMHNNFVYEYNLFNIPKFKNQERIVGLIMNDITEAKYFQKNLMINEKLVALGKVASGIAHEINNPLYAVLASAEEIAENINVDDETRNYAEEIINHVVGVSNIIKDLSIYSKSMRKEDLYDVNLNDVIRQALKLVKYSSNYLDVKINIDLQEIPTIKAKISEMQQVFINLFNNAIFAIGGNGVLDIKTVYENNIIFVYIKDTGSGILEENLPYIFDMFFTTKKEGEGTGQGLHIVKKILEKYNAKIEVFSKINEGSTFILKFKNS